MSRSAAKAPSLRVGLVAAGCALLLSVQAVPASATTPPDAPASGTAAVGSYGADLAWAASNAAGYVVRDVTGVAAPLTVDSGRLVYSGPVTTAHDVGYANTAPATYAVWATAADGTPSASPLTEALSPAAAVPTALAMDLLVPSTRPYGQAFTVVGTLTRAGAPVAGRPVDLYGRRGGTTSTVLLRHLTTGADGTVRTALAPVYSTVLTLRFAGDPYSTPSASAGQSAQVLPRVSASLVPPAMLRGDTTTLLGQVIPGYPGAPVVLQQHVAAGWHGIATVRTAANGSYRFRLSPPVGSYYYRVVLPATGGWRSAVSAHVLLRVDERDLVAGTRGSDVLALQRRLAALHYDVGAQNGVFGYDLTHAVLAFQKVERLPRTGRWTKAERVRVTRPTAWRLRYPSAGTAVEVDITRQVLVLSRAGVVQRVVDVSTGSERTYYQDGVLNVAHTPRGRYAITRRIDALHVSPLG
ncbi:MAG: peptidoglycan-binding protein, partial [Nocardioidaceae bacterium]